MSAEAVNRVCGSRVQIEVEMKCEILIRMILLRLTIPLVGVVAICPLLFTEGKTQATSKPVSLGLLIDASAHQKKVIGFERDAVNLLADRFASQATESLVIRYGDEVNTLQEWSALEPELRRAAARIELDAEEGKKRRTLLYDALDVALGKFGAANNANAKVLIIIGEGNDAGSLAKYSQIKTRAKLANLQCFVLLVADHNLMGGRIRHFGFDLYDLASATKGKAYDVEQSRKNLDKAINGVLKRIR